MKFSHSIQFNAVPDWSSHYIAYSNLKKIIYQLEKSVVRASSRDDTEESALIPNAREPAVDTDLVYRRTLDRELEKISSFYNLKEDELLREVYQLSADAESFEEGRDAESVTDSQLIGESGRRRYSLGGMSGILRTRSSLDEPTDREDDTDDDEEEGQQSGAGTGLLSKSKRGKGWNSNMEGSHTSHVSDSGLFQRRASQTFDEYHGYAVGDLCDKRVMLKKRTISLFVALRELKSFVQLNRTGFVKALKKYDKILNRDLKSQYMQGVVEPCYCFRPETTAELDKAIGKVEDIYASLVTGADLDAAKRELRLHLREHVVWERNTVWRDMIGIERKAQAANMGIRRTLLGDTTDPTRSRLTGDEPEISVTKELETPVGKIKYSAWVFSGGFFVLVALLLVFTVLLLVPMFPSPEQQNCLAMLVFVSLLWATEVIPLFVTSLLVPFLVVLLRVVRSDQKPHVRLETKEATRYIFSAMWTPVIMLLLGGFAIAAALSKYGIAKMLATVVLSKAGTKPRTVLLTNMFVAMFASMWISNVAAPVLCFSIIQPMLRNLPSESRFSKALILGIALASNIGGMASPIASPQNVIALQNMRPAPSWGAWFFVALPVCILSILVIWALLLISFNPSRGTTIVPIRPVRDKFSGVQYFISFVTIVTIILWCFSHQLEHVFGDMGVVAIIPLVLFFGTGILTKEDFNNFLWTIIILAAGGLALGKAVNSSGLLHAIAQAIKEETQGMGLYGVLVVFCALILVIATFISHTVAALIILPIVAQVGASMEEPHPNLLVMGAALMCSAAMGLPTSGFPNMTAIMMENSQTGQRYLRVQHFISRGIPSSVFSFLIVITVGYGLMLIVGF
ncbi:putative plasma membrane phosphate transporter Pho87 [Tuber indicum]|nr:putative plasma membrane phosphate transporter Pho87 [Tuber indicum]